MHARRRRPPSLSRRVPWAPYAAGVAGIAVLLGLLAAASIHRERVRQYELARAQTTTLTHLLEASVDGMLGKIDALLAVLAVQAAEGPSHGDVSSTRRMMASALASTPDVVRWTLCNDGHVPLHVGGDATQPDACSDPMTGSDTGMQLAGPLRRTRQAPWIMAFSRAWQNPTTGERGRIVAELPVARFQRVFGELQLGQEGAATLRTTQLALVYRHPLPPQPDDHIGEQNVSSRLRDVVLQSPRAGLYQTVTSLDQVERLNAYRRLRDYPLYVLVGYPARDYPRGWNRTDLAVIALAVVTALMAALAALALYRTSQRRVETATRRFDTLVASSNDAIVAKTLHGTVTSWNAAAERIFGWRADEMIGHSIRRLYAPEREREEDTIIERVRRGERVQHFDTERLHANGQRVAVSVSISPLFDGSRIVGASMIARDISRQKALEAELRALAFHDALTQLPNRRLFLDRLRHAQEASRRLRSHGGVLFVDLDRFKHLNDTHGHEVGDAMLQEVARRLRAAVREHDTVARLGGDEFVVLCERLGRERAEAERALRQMADKLSRALTEDFRLGPIEWPYGASIGLRLFVGTDEDVEDLLRDADRAMYLDKEKRHTESGVLTDRDTSGRAVDIPL